ncbi:MAG: TetR/AcrR family transcriptional regulator [Bdellovibrio sp.]|nr:TetR/AcrR family transcriptional regulator [Bdellovibrio sp.]
MKTKERILLGALDLFNKDAATEVTTNDIARDLKMSPGNLYFHYKNKEQIVRELFKRLAQETAQIWKPEAKLAKKKQKMQLVDFIDRNLELYWKYRFFHRELYTLRKKDAELSKLWRLHLVKMGRLMIVLHKHWVRSGSMIPIESKSEMEFVGELLFIASNSSMQFFETVDRSPNQRTIEKARRHIMRMLMPYLSVETKNSFENFFN